MKLRSLTFLLFFGLTSSAQTNGEIVSGVKDTVWSDVLSESRTIWVRVPNSSRDGLYGRKRYPVVYLLDGDVFFYSVAGMLQYAANIAKTSPELILVGIEHKDRMKDLTPTHDGTVPKDSNLVRTSGGGELFTKFIQEELIPYVDAHYPTTSYKVLVGHSLGGLLAVNTLINHSSLFNAYIAVDPALFWDNQMVVKQSASVLRHDVFTNKSLYIGWSGALPEKKDSIMKDSTLSTIVERSNLLFDELVKTYPNNGLLYKGKYYESEDHNSVSFFAIYEALRFTFAFTVPPDIDKMSQSVEFYAKHYEKVSERMGYTVLPPENLINGKGYYFLYKKMYDKARGFFQLNIDNYPDSYNVYDSMSDLYAAEGNKPKAIEYLKKELTLKDLPYIRQKLAELEK